MNTLIVRRGNFGWNCAIALAKCNVPHYIVIVGTRWALYADGNLALHHFKSHKIRRQNGHQILCQCRFTEHTCAKPDSCSHNSLSTNSCVHSIGTPTMLCVVHWSNLECQTRSNKFLSGVTNICQRILPTVKSPYSMRNNAKVVSHGKHSKKGKFRNDQ